VTLTDVSYSTLPGYRPLHLDLYRPIGETSPKPLVVFLHGGAWAFANPRAGAAFRNFPEVLAHLAARGYVVASVEYRFVREAPFPAQLEDVQSAIRFLRQNAAHFGIDGRRLALWGMSAGAYLAAMDALNCASDTCVNAWVGWFGIYDFTTVPADEAGLRQLLGCGSSPCAKAALEAASPIRFADRSDPPTLLLHGTADELPSSASEQLAQRLREAGVSVELALLPGVGHGMVGTTEAETKAALRQALTTTFDFLDRQLRK
jgi:acetyl esterase/lipase